jgi:hypothetical protein
LNLQPTKKLHQKLKPKVTRTYFSAGLSTLLTFFRNPQQVEGDELCGGQLLTLRSGRKEGKPKGGKGEDDKKRD